MQRFLAGLTDTIAVGPQHLCIFRQRLDVQDSIDLVKVVYDAHGYTLEYTLQYSSKSVSLK